jgi:hypothetical protein
MTRTAQNARVMAAVLADMPPLFPVSAPVDCGDETAFPEIARAVAHAKALRGEA